MSLSWIASAINKMRAPQDVEDGNGEKERSEKGHAEGQPGKATEPGQLLGKRWGR